MDRAQQSRDQQEDAAGQAQQGPAPGRRTGDGGQSAGDGGQPAAAHGGGGAGAGAGGAGAWEADPALMSAMGLDHGGGGGGGGDKKLDGITTPPKGKTAGIATPDVNKTLEDKSKLLKKAGIPASSDSGGGGGRGASKAGPPPSGGGGVKAHPPAAAAVGPAPAGQAPGGDHANAPHAPGDKTAPAVAHGGGPPAAHGDGDPSVDAFIAELEHGTDPSARIKAAQALAKSRSSKAKPALERAVRDHDPAVAAAAKKALSQLGLAH